MRTEASTTESRSVFGDCSFSPSCTSCSPRRTASSGGHLRVLVRQAGYRYDPDCIEAIAHACVAGDETLLRVLYYDCAPYRGNPRLPVSGEPALFQGSDEWLKVLAAKPHFAVRLGTLKFRGFEPKRVPIASFALSDEDFRLRFEQKGVDMRLGLDIASYAADRSVDRIILVTGDTDCLPVMKRSAKTRHRLRRRHSQRTAPAHVAASPA